MSERESERERGDEITSRLAVVCLSVSPKEGGGITWSVYRACVFFFLLSLPPLSLTLFLILQWLGSSEHADFLQGRQILLTTVCNGTAGGAPPSPATRVCFPMRVAGMTNTIVGATAAAAAAATAMAGRIRSAPLTDLATAVNQPSASSQQLRETPTTDGGGGSGGGSGNSVETGVLVAAACGGALGVLYVIVLAVFVASRLRKRQKGKQHIGRSRQHSTAIDGETGVAVGDGGRENLACDGGDGAGDNNNGGAKSAIFANGVERNGGRGKDQSYHQQQQQPFSGPTAYSMWSEEVRWCIFFALSLFPYELD